MRRTRGSRSWAGAVALSVLVAVVAAVPLTSAQAAPTDRFTLDPSGNVTFVVKGNGHGHGLSQYGAEGAAERGLSAGQILGFYYPGTTMVTLPSSVRVDLSGTGTTLTVAPADGLVVSGVRQKLPVDGVAAYRLVADGSGVQLQKKPVRASWQVLVPRALPAGSAFSRPNGAEIRVLRADGTSINYHDQLRAYPQGGSTVDVNDTTMDNYVRGVVPREVPASWDGAAIRAQAIAARTYARYAVIHPENPDWDICDTSSCQVFGGAVKFDRNGKIVYVDDGDAVKFYANVVLRYGRSVAFTQFSASNGGWMADGGQPYLPAKADPYDTPSLDPYFSYTATVSVAQLAAYFGKPHLTGIALNRDGDGQWGGRVVSAVLYDDIDQTGPSTVSGLTLQYAIAAQDFAGSTYLTVRG